MGAGKKYWMVLTIVNTFSLCVLSAVGSKEFPAKGMLSVPIVSLVYSITGLLFVDSLTDNMAG